MNRKNSVKPYWLLTVVALTFLFSVSLAHASTISCGTDPNTANPLCFADSVAYHDDTTWCDGALGGPFIDNDAAAVGADCDNVADAHGKTGCNRQETDQPYCHDGNGILVLDMGANQEIVNAHDDWDFYVEEGGAGEPYSVAVSTDGSQWLDLGGVCDGSVLSIPGKNLNQKYRYVKFTARGDLPRCDGSDQGSAKYYGADIDFVMARSIPCSGDLCVEDDAECVSNTIPATMTLGQHATVSVTIKNDGTTTWTKSANYKLGSQSPQDNLVWGLNRVELSPSASVYTGQQYTFTFDIVAPTTPGTYHNFWKMLQEHVAWFGEKCGRDVVVQGVCTPGQIELRGCGNCGSQMRVCQSDGTWGNYGDCMNQGPCSPGSTDQKSCGNCGTKTRTCQSTCQWGSYGNCLGQGPCSPGQTQTQSCNTGLPGICSNGNQSRTCQSTCQWNPYGICNPVNHPRSETCNDLDDNCNGKTDEVCATCLGDTIPYSIAAGQTQHVIVTVRNDGSAPWTRNENYKLGSQNPQDNLVWGLGRALIDVNASVVHGQSYTFGFDIVAPTTPGIYHDEWRMLKEYEFWFLPPNCGHDVNVTTTTCTPGQVQTQPCGNCGSQSRTCQSNGEWGPYGTCMNQGPCSPGQQQQRTCGTDVGECQAGNETRTCQSTCQWGSYQNCNAIGPAPEICDGKDNDCNSVNDNGFNNENCQPVCTTSGFVWTGHGGNLNCCGNDPHEDDPYQINETLCDGNDNDCDGYIDEYLKHTCKDYSDCSMYQTCDTCPPAPPEVCDGRDNNCNGQIDEGFDTDHDGWTTCNGDCNDNNPNVYPGKQEYCSDGIDNNCDGYIDCQDSDCFTNPVCNPCPDNDHDGWTVCQGDCNDNNPNIYPGKVEYCSDGIDNNCDGYIDCQDSDCFTNPVCNQCPDNDHDSWTTCNGDCDDNNPNINPGKQEYCTDGIDNNCNGYIDCQDSQCATNPVCNPCPDNDHDSWTICQGDCDDANNLIHPGAQEICNGIDDDCDGYVDENNVCQNCQRDQISLRGDSGVIQSIANYTSFKSSTMSYSSWINKLSDGSYYGILSMDVKGTLSDGEPLQLRFKGKVVNVNENDCGLLDVDNVWWSLGTFQVGTNPPQSITFDNIHYIWDRAANTLDLSGVGPELNFVINDIKISCATC